MNSFNSFWGSNPASIGGFGVFSDKMSSLEVSLEVKVSLERSLKVLLEGGVGVGSSSIALCSGLSRYLYQALSVLCSVYTQLKHNMRIFSTLVLVGLVSKKSITKGGGVFLSHLV